MSVQGLILWPVITVCDLTSVYLLFFQTENGLLELVISPRSQGQAPGVLISRSVGFWRHRGGEKVSECPHYGSCHSNARRGREPQAAAGGCSTETSCLQILLAWAGERGSLWQGTQRQTVLSVQH